jgi:hypothetical protein
MKSAKFLAKTGTYMTPAGRMVYASLFKPTTMKGETDMSKAKYQITLLLPKDVDISVLEKAADDARNEKWTPKVQRDSKLKSPFLKTADNPRLAEYAEEFPHMLRFNSKSRPGVLTKSMTSVSEADEPDEIYNGRWCRVSCSPFAYDVSGSKGVSLGLGNVQLLDHAERIVGGAAKASDEFEAVGGEDLEDMVG